MTPWGLFKEAIRAVPELKYALAVGGVIAVIGLIYGLQLAPQVAILGFIVMILGMTLLLIFVKVTHAPNTKLELQGQVLSWFVILMFMVTVITLFLCIFFRYPRDLGLLLLELRGENFKGVEVSPPAPPIIQPPSEPPKQPIFQSADSGWRGGGSSPAQYCGSVLLNLQEKYPDRMITVTSMKEDHKSTYTPFKHDYYRYKCDIKIE